MAKLDVKATVTAPSEINIPLVRGDHHEVSGVFRVCFEVGLSIFSTVLGYTLPLPAVDIFQWAVLVVVGIATLAFLVLSANYGKRAREV